VKYVARHVLTGRKPEELERLSRVVRLIGAAYGSSLFRVDCSSEVTFGPPPPPPPRRPPNLITRLLSEQALSSLRLPPTTSATGVPACLSVCLALLSTPPSQSAPAAALEANHCPSLQQATQFLVAIRPAP
jgi:hypothetical protein